MRMGAQYYRAPFPERRFWADDFARMRDSGFDTVQLWVLWAWVEAVPGEFRYEDYDELVALAEKNGLGVVLSTVAEIQPLWIHRVIPDCELVAQDGRKFISVHRHEVHFGLTPGGCTDHPDVWARMAQFLETTVRRYADAAPLVGWDAWNELRWKEGADSYGMRPCYCAHTLAAFREWLEEQYGSLEALNRAWKRRYAAWEDVQPARVFMEPYSHGMAFQRFITERSNRHGVARYRLMKAIDRVHPVTVHPPGPCTEYAGGPYGYALERGNDWDYADELDGVGVSSFPKWRRNVRSNWADFADRIGVTHSAARGKQVWLSELQGGRAATGVDMFDPVEPADQQRWVWIARSYAADMLLFWCWRDEVFGKESGGFGLSGGDGFAEARLAAMRRSAGIMREHAGLLRGYRPDHGSVGVWFSPLGYYQEWVQDQRAERAMRALYAWRAALTRASIPHRIVEERHLDELRDLRLLILPRTVVLEERAERELERWVRGGGRLVCESETGAFNAEGFYRYPGDRWVACLTGAVEVGRRDLGPEPIRVRVPGCEVRALRGTTWRTPMESAGDVWSADEDGALVREVRVGEGSVLLCGTYFGTPPDGTADDFAGFVEDLAGYAGVARTARFLAPPTGVSDYPFCRYGRAGERDVLFCFTPIGVGEAQVELSANVFPDGRAHDLIAGREAGIAGRVLTYEPDPWGIAVIVS